MTVAELHTAELNPQELNAASKSKNPSATFRNILVATDFSTSSSRALRWALALAGENNARISLIHVLQPDRKLATLENPPELDPQRIAAQLEIRILREEFGRDVDAELVKHGPVAEQVAAAIEEKGIDLLVIGTRGRGGLTKLALGSVAEELLRLAPCPVMTIGPTAGYAAITNGPGFHQILFATDFGPGSAKALPLALALTRERQAKLILLHMISPMPVASASMSAYAPAGPAADDVREWEGSARKEALRRLRECLPAQTGLDQEPEYVVGTDFLAEGVLMAVSKFKVDLIVMGANRKGSARAAAHIPWTAVHEIVRNAPCPVLTVAG